MGLDALETFEELKQERIQQLKKSIQKSYPSKNGLMIPEIAVLYYARTFRTNQENFQSFWYYKYAVENPKEILQMLIDKGFICYAPARNSLTSLTVLELKEILRKLGLKVSGNKKDLLKRVLENADDEFLEKEISSKSFELTELGIQELKENEYVFYCHNQTDYDLINQGIDVFWINEQMHNHPNVRYRDLIWGELNKNAINSMKKIQLGDYSSYIYSRKIMAKFLMEEKNNFDKALSLFAEAIYYEFNVESYKTYLSLLENYQRHLDYEREYPDFFNRHLSEPEVKESFYIDLTVIKKISEELELSDNQLFQKLINSFDMFNAPKQIVSDNNLSGLIVSLLNGDTESVDYVYEQIHDVIQNEAEIRYNQTK